MKRPLTVTVIAWVLIAAGVVGIAYHITEIKLQQPFPVENVLILLLRLLAIVCGAFMLRASNWARWVAVAWIALHVVISFYHSREQVLAHAIIFALITYALFRADANAYFRPAGSTS